MVPLYDLFILIFIPLLAYRGYKRGAFLSICGFLMCIVAFLGATFVTENLHEPVSRLVQPVVKQAITEVLEEALEGKNLLVEPPDDLEEGEDPETYQYITVEYAFLFLESAPALEKYSGLIQVAKESLTEGVNDFAGSASDVISEFIGTKVARAAIFTVSFLLLLFIWSLSTKTLNLVFKLPFLAEFNQVIGAGIGFCLAVLLIFVGTWVTKGSIIPWSDIDKTLLLQLFAYYNPLESLAQISDTTLNL